MESSRKSRFSLRYNSSGKLVHDLFCDDCVGIICFMRSQKNCYRDCAGLLNKTFWKK